MHIAVKFVFVALAIIATVNAFPGGYGSGGSSGYSSGGSGGYGSGSGYSGGGGYDGGNGLTNSYHNQAYDSYDFGHDVSSPHYGNYHGRKESGTGNAVKGSYYLQEADGSMRRVDYVATHPGGFVATVTDKHGSKTYGNTGYGGGDDGGYGSGGSSGYSSGGGSGYSSGGGSGYGSSKGGY